MKHRWPYFFVGAITVMLLLFPNNAIEYAKSSLSLCQNVIIPSLFPFFVCSGLLIHSGVAQFLAKVSKHIMKPIFNIGGAGATAFVLGIIGGYPLGAITTCQLYEAGYLSKTETERLLAFCNNSGPLFILGAVGTAIYADISVGIVLYLSHIIATLIVGILFRFYKRNSHTAPTYSINQNDDGFALVFSKVLANSINSILTVCGAIIFFGVVSGIVTSILPFDDSTKAILYGLLELSGGTMAISNAFIPEISKLSLSAVCIGFSGICVHLQVAAVTAKQHLSLYPYLIGKVLHGLLAGIFTFLYLYLFPITKPVFNGVSPILSPGFCMSSVYSIINLGFILLISILVFPAYFRARRSK